MQFHERPRVAADDVILPEETLAMIHRQVIGVAEHREQLLAARQHLKRGLLLYGPPGVGKTHTVRYLVGQLADLTIVELTGEALGLIGTACSVARTLQPAMIVVEDVDLIAEDRGMHPGHHPLLFQLLNEMDGLAEDTDVVFLLTTNRADVLEPALAARPGRVDQAVVMELPDADARRRLFDLYRGALTVDESRLEQVLARTEGVTASFLKELLRRSALIAADGSRRRAAVGQRGRARRGARRAARHPQHDDPGAAGRSARRSHVSPGSSPYAPCRRTGTPGRASGPRRAKMYAAGPRLPHVALARAAPVAQGIERRFPKPCVAGSNPAGGTQQDRSSEAIWTGLRRREGRIGPGATISGTERQRSNGSAWHGRVAEPPARREVRATAGTPRSRGPGTDCRS